MKGNRSLRGKELRETFPDHRSFAQLQGQILLDNTFQSNEQLDHLFAFSLWQVPKFNQVISYISWLVILSIMLWGKLANKPISDIISVRQFPPLQTQRCSCE